MGLEINEKRKMVYDEEENKTKFEFDRRKQRSNKEKQLFLHHN